jgi:hypothetical protein
VIWIFPSIVRRSFTTSSIERVQELALKAWLVYEQRVTEPHPPLEDAPWRAEVDALAARGRGFQQAMALKRHAEALQTSNPKLAAAAFLEAADVFSNKLANRTEAAKCLASAAVLSGGAVSNETPQ